MSDELLDRVLGGEADDYLDELKDAVSDRKKIVAQRLVSGIKVGDRIRFNASTRPVYLQGVEATVTKKLQKNVQVELDEAAGRYEAGSPITVPAVLVERAEAS